MATLPKFKTQLEWQIDRRWRIQQFLFELYSFLDEHTEFHRESADQWFPIVRMVDIAFSLWRSAFLTNVKRERQTIYDHMKEFLKKVLEHNSITFADDYRMCELTVGYYNSNARYRLERMYSFDEELLQLKSVQDVDGLRKLDDLSVLRQDELWDKYYLALLGCFEKFKSNWDQNVRPHRHEAARKTTRAQPKRRAVTGDGGSTARQPRRRRGR